MHTIPMTQRQANAWIEENHRHLAAPRGDIFRVAAAGKAGVVGVVIVGRPKARMLDDGVTCEVTRLASDGTKNVCSYLYARAVKVARALGYRRIVTYTLGSETGHSLRASGWEEEGPAGGGEWDRPSRGRETGKLPVEQKVRWSKSL